jgi:hypothetical protein
MVLFMSEDWLPPFASGRIAGSYRLLRRYLEVARERNRDEAFENALLREEDYELLKSLAREGESALELVDRLTDILVERVDPEIAEEALRREGILLSGEEARRIIARLLASWLIEAGEYWKIISLENTKV